VNTVDPSVLVDDVDDVDDPIDYRSMVILGAHVQANERPFPDHVDWGYFPNHYAFTRVTDYGFTGQSLPADEYLLTAEYPCFVGDDVWERSDGWFERYLLEFLHDEGIDAEAVDAVVRRAPRAYPLPVTEEIERFERIDARLSSYENVYNLGRMSTYEYIWIKDIVQHAFETREEIATDTGLDA